LNYFFHELKAGILKDFGNKGFGYFIYAKFNHFVGKLLLHISFLNHKEHSSKGPVPHQSSCPLFFPPAIAVYQLYA